MLIQCPWSVTVDLRTLVVLCLIVRPALVDAQSRHSLTLDATIRRVLETHPSIGAAAEGVRAARGSRLTARSWTNPTLNYEVERAPLPGRTTPVGMERETRASVMFPLEPVYQLRSRASRANAELRRAEADLLESRRQTVLTAAEAFHRAASAQVAVEAGVEIRAWLDSLLDYTRKRVQEGATAEVDLIRLEVEQGRVETDLAIARVELARAATDLGVLLGFDSVTADVADDSLPAPRTLPALGDLLALAIKNRPDLRAAEANVAATRAGVGVERAAIVREVGVMAGVMSMDGTRSLMAGVTMPFPLFDQNRGEIQRASAEGHVAELDRTLVERRVTADVASAYSAVQALTAQVSRISGSLLTRAEDGRRIAEGAYREGAVPLVQVLDAARALAEARTLFYRVRFAWRQSLIELNAAIGATDLSTLPSEVR